jgi:hypothetical protein
MEPRQSSTDGTQPSGSGWLFPLFLTLVLVAMWGIARQIPQQQPARPTEPATAETWMPAPEGETVGLTIDFGNGVQKRFTALPWQPEMTVADLLSAARQFPPGIRFTQQGEGERGLLVALEGLANEGVAGRNWIYQVDGQHAHSSFCLEKIEPGMHILWTFTDQQYNEPGPDATPEQ